MKSEELLVNRLKAYADTDMYPFHMPGHKRLNGGGASELFRFPNPFQIDITEIEGFDNLHHPEGILMRSMEWAAGIYGADQTYYLVNGSSSGILSAVCGATDLGGRILISRNCHKSVYHGIYLNRLKSVYVYPQRAGKTGIQGGILPKDVDKLLEEYPDIQAVLIVSPTYDGVVSDIGSIAEAAHRRGIPLIVDEAHGAHFRYFEEFPRSALELGADVVIQSVHKTIPSLTQTALLHVKCNKPSGEAYIDRGRLDRYIHIYQSSSPSYVLMAAIENAVYYMSHMSQEEKNRYVERLMRLRSALREMKQLRLLDKDLKGRDGIYDLDESKIVISTGMDHGTAPITGAELDHILREKYHLEMEMCGADYVTAITSVMDSQEGLERLGRALLEIDRELEIRGKAEEPEMGVPKAEVRECTVRAAMTIAEALDRECDVVGLEECEERIAGEYIYVYPPGIPIVAPGERISSAILKTVVSYISQGLPVQGPADESLKTIRVVR